MNKCFSLKNTHSQKVVIIKLNKDIVFRYKGNSASKQVNNQSINQTTQRITTGVHGLQVQMDLKRLYTRIKCPRNAYPLIPHFYVRKLGNTLVYIFHILIQKHRLWNLTLTYVVHFGTKVNHCLPVLLYESGV